MKNNCNPCSDINCNDETIKTTVKNCNDTGFSWPSHPLKAKLPVRVGFAHVGEVIIDNVTFPNNERFSEIKKIQRKVVVTQAKIVCKQLVVEGFIQKNIMYTTPITPGTTVCCPVVRNEVRDIEVIVPFCFSTPLHHLDLGHLHEKEESEKVFLENTMGDNVCDKGIMGDADCAKVHNQFTPLNKPAFAELEGYSICELALNRHGCPDGLFDTFTEKFVLKLCFSIYKYKHCPVYCPGSKDIYLTSDGIDTDSIDSIDNTQEEEMSEGLLKLKEDF
ncbi:hypothetical protein [Clostridium gasigenes]|uniref:hypothetical protein n=1 Tax=Clostridium gasigenes TaxID=94869 RepID=UPI0014384FAB|nr:hypothetical protein [Clostridium gasigenes]MBU3102504.1 hypothetical protein [Clostridium gasigenes]NKF08589.1 hypothetical protein [Clostridium gasigenes]QSW18377.1 hypothetical protein J1C67_12545 [Clostridium gasigenes]